MPIGTARTAYFTPQAVAPTLSLAVALETGLLGTSSATISLDSTVAVSTNDFLIAIVGSRRDVTRTHNSVVASGFTGTFTKQIDDEQDAGGVFVRMSAWTCTVSAGGTGNITATLNNTAFQLGLILLRVPAGVSVGQTAIGKSATGTGNSVAWSATPNVAGLSVGMGMWNGAASPALADHAAISGGIVDANSNFRLGTWQKLLSPPDPLVFSGSLNNEPRVVGALNILGE